MQREHWHLTEGLIFAHFAVFILSASMSGGLQALALIPGSIGARPWTLVTYQFVHGSSMFWFFISMLVLWIMARPIEESWGSPRFLAFWLVSTFGASLTAAALARPLFGDVGFGTCLLFTFATLYPEVEFRLFFIIPVKVKYLAVIAAAILVYSSFSFGIVGGLANIAGVSAGYLFFLATRRLPSRRKFAFEIKKKRADAVIRTENQQAESRNRAWDAAVKAAAERARAGSAVADEDQALLDELDAAKDPSITVCAPTEFGFVDDDVCKGCTGFAECAARHIRMAADESKS
ncbi:MAG: rhomboid family intramembrane serine protease [Acidobacteria bacterium]|jgi:membrane associated rhomboid family serine protease|nr:rhomboid family intramembrane serine protease [Acidobacteriota bacterium]